MYSNSKPQLVSKNLVKQLAKTFKVARVEQIKWEDSMGNFYEDYVRPNLFALIVFSLLALFLCIKYALKVDKTKKKARIRRLSRKIQYKGSIDEYNLPIYDDNLSKQLDSVYDGSIYPDYMLDDELVDGNNNQLYSLQREYEYNVKNNDGTMSEQMMKDMYENKTSKFLFDEMSKVMSGK